MRILIGVSSGISIYKSLNVIRELVKNKHQVKVIMTENSTKLINPLVFKTLSQNEVYYKDFDINTPLAHIELSDWADIFAILPATANIISKIANGIADDILTTTFVAFNKRKVIFPSMNVKMYENPITRKNIQLLRQYGIEVIEPDYGELACGYKGRGRLPSEDYIIGIIDKYPENVLNGKKFIVTAGATIEKIDPVRYISNFSSGKMGISIAKTLYKYGANVLIINGKVDVQLPSYIPSIKAESTLDMLNAIENNIHDYDGLFMAAAPADFRVENYSDEKIKKQDLLNIKLIQNPDILKYIKEKYPDKIFIGFALESADYIENAKNKLKQKSLDYIILNKITKDFNPMGNDENQVILIDKNGNIFEKEIASKDEIAEWLIKKIFLNS